MGSSIGGLVDSIHRAELGATGTADTLILINGVGHQMLTDLGGTLLVHNMGKVRLLILL